MSESAVLNGLSSLTQQVCAAARAVLRAAPDADLARRRAELRAARVEGPAGAALRRVLDVLRDGPSHRGLHAETVGGELVRAGGALERAAAHPAARELFELAVELRPSCPSTAMHAGRASRRSGDADRARQHYARARALSSDERINRLARIGEAMVSAAAEAALSQEIRHAVRSGDAEAAGVGLEARAAVRCESARCREAIRDLCACALRYPDREDQARAAERVAALLIESGDLDAAREALLLVNEIGTAEQRSHARARLHAISVELGDVLGERRWGGSKWATHRSPTGAHDASGGAGLERSGSPALEAGRAATRTRPGRTLPVIRDWRTAVARRAGAP